MKKKDGGQPAGRRLSLAAGLREISKTIFPQHSFV